MLMVVNLIPMELAIFYYPRTVVLTNRKMVVMTQGKNSKKETPTLLVQLLMEPVMRATIQKMMILIPCLC